MTHLDYTQQIPLPAPLASGAAFASYIDPMGKVWIAKGGVFSGAWKDPRDVLHARLWKSATWSTTTALNNMAFGSVDTDIWGMQNAANGWFVIPLQGLYLVTSTVQWGATAASQWFLISIVKNGSEFSRGSLLQSVAAFQMTHVASAVVPCNVGDTIAIFQQASGAYANVGGTGTQVCNFAITYLGRWG